MYPVNGRVASLAIPMLKEPEAALVLTVPVPIRVPLAKMESVVPLRQYTRCVQQLSVMLYGAVSAIDPLIPPKMFEEPSSSRNVAAPDPASQNNGVPVFDCVYTHASCEKSPEPIVDNVGVAR